MIEILEIIIFQEYSKTKKAIEAVAPLTYISKTLGSKLIQNTNNPNNAS
jgi:hypothetical protein